MEIEAARRKPVDMNGAADGRTTFSKKRRFGIRKARAVSAIVGSMRRAPWWVCRMIGKTTAKNTTTAFISTVRAIKRIRTGTSAIAGNARPTSNKIRVDISAAGDLPVSKPSGIPIMAATAKPSTALASVALKALQNVAENKAATNSIATATGSGTSAEESDCVRNTRYQMAIAIRRTAARQPLTPNAASTRPAFRVDTVRPKVTALAPYKRGR